MQLHWRTCAGDAWCPFRTAVLPDANVSGILLVWSAADERVVYLGAGPVAKALRWARQFAPIAAYPDLLVTWATVPEDVQTGVRNYLLRRLPVVHSDRATSEPPIAVNLPWEPS